MAWKIIDWLFGTGEGTTSEGKKVTMQKILEAAAELQIRDLALTVCVNMIANAVGKCEFQTFVRGEKVRGDEYYTWNIEPNINENSTMFLHRLVDKLCRENEVLVISTTHKDGHEMLVVADEFAPPKRYPQKMNIYTDVRVGEVTYKKSFKESEVLHMLLNNTNAQEVVKRLYASYSKLISSATKSYTWGQGTHLKVKVDQTESGDENFAKDFAEMINEQVKPFMQGDNAVLPEFEGYEYEDIGGTANTERSTRDIRALVDDIFDFTAQSLNIPPVLIKGVVQGTQDAVTRWLTTGIDPLCDQLEEEVNRKRYGRELWKNGTYMHIDTSTITHFDLFANAGNIEKLIGSGAYSINDVLVAAGMPKINEPWADLHWLTLNIGTMEAAARAINDGGKGGKGE